MGVYVCEPCATKYGLTPRPHTSHEVVCEICVEGDGNYHTTKTCRFVRELERPLEPDDRSLLAQLEARK